MKLGIIGYGRMGQVIHRLAPQYGFSDFITIDNEDDWRKKRAEIQNCEVAIEFSIPQTVLANLTQCFELQLPVVSGTTGWKEEKESFLKLWQKQHISFIYGSNFSIGANLFFKLNQWLAQQMNLQPQYKVAIEETHHIHKKDAPSGTALTIEQVILSQFDHKTTIPITSFREGETVGEHLVNYESTEDYIQIKHTVHTRDAFAHGALKAAVWLTQHPGVYDFGDIFGKV